MQPLHRHLFGAVLCVFLPTILRDDEFDDAALGSAAGADCDDDGMLSYRSNLSLSPRRRAVLATLLEIVY